MDDILSEAEEVQDESSEDQKKEKKPFPFKKNKKEEKEPAESSDDEKEDSKQQDSGKDEPSEEDDVRPADKYNKERFVPKPKKEEKKSEEPKSDEEKSSDSGESSSLSSDQKLAAEVAAKTAAETAKAMANGQPPVTERPDVPSVSSVSPEIGGDQPSVSITPTGEDEGPSASGSELDSAVLSSLGAGSGALALRKQIRQVRGA